MSSHRLQHTLSTAYTEYSIHRVQHTPSTASIQDCLSCLHSHDYELTPECSFSFRRASPWELKGKVTLSHSHGCELTNWWKQSPHLARCPSTASQYSSKLARLRPASASSNLLHYGLQTRSITASKCISKLSRLRHPSSHDHGLQVHLHTRSMTASKSISKLDRSRPPSASPNSLDRSLQCISKLARSRPPKCISKLARSRPSIASSKVHLQTRSIMAPACILKFTRSSFSGAPQIALKHRLQPVQKYRV